MIIAVDFDGTIVEHRYPAIGAEIPFAIETLKKLAREQHRLILWTVRKGKLLEEAVEFCRKRGLEFYAVNRNYPEETEEQAIKWSRKLKADVWIDDRNVGGLPEWGVIYQLIHNEVTYDEYLRKNKDKKKPKAFIGFFTQLFNKQDYTKNLTDL